MEDRKPTAKKAPPATATKKAPPERLNLEAVSTPPRTSKKATIVTEAMMTPPPKKGISKSAFQSASKMLTSAGRTLKTFDKNRRASQKEANAHQRASQKEANANIRAANANDKVLLNMTNKHMTKVHSLVDQ